MKLVPIFPCHGGSGSLQQIVVGIGLTSARVIPVNHCPPVLPRVLPQIKAAVACTQLRPSSRSPPFPAETHHSMDLPAPPQCRPTYPLPRFQATLSSRVTPQLSPSRTESPARESSQTSPWTKIPSPD